MRNRTPDSSHRWYDELKSENTVALLDRLEAEMDKGEIMDLDLIDVLLQLLNEKAPLPEPSETPEEGLRKFKEKYGPLLDLYAAEEEKKERKPRPVGRRILRVAMAACLCVVMLGVVAQASGIDLIGRFLEWHEETFVFHGQGSGQMALESVPEGEYASAEEAVAAYDITDPVVPKWIPARFGIQSVRVKELSNAVNITARYVGDSDQKMVLKIYMSEDDSDPENIVSDIHSEHSSPGQKPDRYPIGDVTFVLAENNAQYRAAWKAGACTCSINGDLTKKEITKMVDSIFLEEG